MCAEKAQGSPHDFNQPAAAQFGFGKMEKHKKETRVACLSFVPRR